MNITPHNTSIPLATVVNPPTEGLRRENNMREIITPPAAVSQSAAEKGVASEKEKAKAPGQRSEDVDFTGIRKQAEARNNTISDSSEHQGESSSEQQQQQTSDSSSEATSADKEDTERNAQQEKNTAAQDEQPNEAEQRVIANLEKRDVEVRAHERAHSAVGGSATGSPSYSFETGPDGKRYATSGEVSVDLSPVSGNPQATITKMQTIKAAALAPATPSNQDRRVAASATQSIVQIQTDIATGADQSSPANALKQSSDSFQDEDKTTSNTTDSNSDFDAQMKQSLNNLEESGSSRPEAVDQRAIRIEQHYLKINNAYEQAPSYNFQLTA
jgi:hypothetical protein